MFRASKKNWSNELCIDNILTVVLICVQFGQHGQPADQSRLLNSLRSVMYLLTNRVRYNNTHISLEISRSNTHIQISVL